MFKPKAWTQCAVVLAVVIFLAGTATAQGPLPVYLSDSFTGSSVSGWTLTGDASLTGGSVDPAGQGWLRLTGDDTNQSSFAYADAILPTNLGLRIQFDFVIWSSTAASIGDGFVVALFDANTTPSAGAYGVPWVMPSVVLTTSIPMVWPVVWLVLPLMNLVIFRQVAKAG